MNQHDMPRSFGRTPRKPAAVKLRAGMILDVEAATPSDYRTFRQQAWYTDCADFVPEEGIEHNQLAIKVLNATRLAQLARTFPGLTLKPRKVSKPRKPRVAKAKPQAKPSPVKLCVRCNLKAADFDCPNGFCCPCTDAIQGGANPCRVEVVS